MRKKHLLKSLYIHIPFCKRLCSYCDFCKNFYDKNIVSKYLDSLENEININYNREILDTLYIGGGTPSSLSEKDLTRLFNILKVFNLSNNYEFTFECNYEDITEDLLSMLKNNRVNRLSIGIQTFNEKYEKILNRDINKSDIKEKISLAKKYFNNINVDLMYALPNETLNDLKKDLMEFVKLDVNHISTYALIIEAHTKLKIMKIKEIDDDLQSKMYYFIVNTLKSNGYNHYELSNFSKKGFESKHNLTYWNNEEYYGFGAGASGFIKGVRYDNTKSLKNYIDGKIIAYSDVVSKDQMMKDEVMLSLRKIKGIDKGKYKNKYNISLEDVFNYKSLVNDNLLVEDEHNLYISPNMLFVSNEIIIRLLDLYTLNK